MSVNTFEIDMLARLKIISANAFVDDFDKDEEIEMMWFQGELNHTVSQEELEETRKAQRFQYDNKIINKFGAPYGCQMSKEYKALVDEAIKQRRPNKWEKKALKAEKKEAKAFYHKQKYVHAPQVKPYEPGPKDVETIKL